MSVTVEATDPKVLPTIRDYGDQALLLEFESTAEVLAAPMPSGVPHCSACWTSSQRRAPC